MRRASVLSSRREQGGAALVIVLVVLLVVELAGVAAAQIVLMGERSTRNQRDHEIAWQAAEAALADAEVDLQIASGDRQTMLLEGVNVVDSDSGCNTGASTRGICKALQTGKPSWLLADFMQLDDSSPSVAYGTFSSRPFSSGSSGVRPVRKPRYIIELIPDNSGTPGSTFVYRITAIGFGPRADIQVVLQTIYRL